MSDNVAAALGLAGYFVFLLTVVMIAVQAISRVKSTVTVKIENSAPTLFVVPIKDVVRDSRVDYVLLRQWKDTPHWEWIRTGRWSDGEWWYSNGIMLYPTHAIVIPPADGVQIIEGKPVYNAENPDEG